MGAPSPVFVAGTGRCGTSQLAHVLDEHPLIHRIPGETHFIVDPGGLRDLADALTVRFDPTVGDDALRRLHDLLRVRLVERNDASFPGGNVPAAVGERHYWDAVGQLERELVAGTFDELVPAPGPDHSSWGQGPFPRTQRRALPRYFGDRRELIAILRRAVRTMFDGAAADAGKPTWCEKTPFNLFAMDFLWELVPEATIVHITRHPVAVLASLLDQPWAPSTVDGALAWLKPVYERWLSWKATADLDAKPYIELRAEDLAADWPAQRAALFQRLGVDDVETTLAFRSERLDHRHGDLDPGSREVVEAALADVIPAMGYDLGSRHAAPEAR